MNRNMFCLFLGIAALLGLACNAQAENLLVNPGFESGAISDSPGQSGVQNSWNYLTGNGYFRPDSVLGPVVDTQAFFHSGSESVSTCADLNSPWDVNTLLAQRHAVAPDTYYTASAWVYAREMVAGSGLGYGPNDRAGVRIVELDESYGVVLDRGVAALYDVTTDFVQVSQTFKTGANTRYVDYVLDTVMSNPDGYWGARVIYDDCELTQVPEPGTIALLSTGLVGLMAYAWRKRK